MIKEYRQLDTALATICYAAVISLSVATAGLTLTISVVAIEVLSSFLIVLPFIATAKESLPAKQYKSFDFTILVGILPLVEELFFRNLLLVHTRSLFTTMLMPYIASAERVGSVAALTFSSILFATAHHNHEGHWYVAHTVLTLFSGFFLGAVMLKTGHLFLVVAAHSSWNACVESRLLDHVILLFEN